MLYSHFLYCFKTSVAFSCIKNIYLSLLHSGTKIEMSKVWPLFFLVWKCALPVPLDLSKADWSKIDLSKADWSKIDLSKANWSKIDWSKIDLSHVKLSNIQPNQPSVWEAMDKLEQLNTNSTTIVQVLKASGTDKYFWHHYEQHYEGWMSPFKTKNGFKMLEIGVHHGHSLLAWAKYFTKPDLILGLTHKDKKSDANPAYLVKKLGNKRVQILEGDQTKMDSLENVADYGPFDIIIDDGSHVPRHVIFTFTHLWKNIRFGGVYIIEDLETSYWNGNIKEAYGYPLKGAGIGEPPPGNAVEKIKQLIDVLMRIKIGARNLSIIPGDQTICNIDFGMNVVAIWKCSMARLYEQKKIKEFKNVINYSHLEKYLQKAQKTNVLTP